MKLYLDTIDTNKTYVVGVSGGVDSVVLLDVLSTIFQGAKGSLVVAHVNHGLRNDADNDADFVQALAVKYGCEYTSSTLPQAEHLSEEAGRSARYALYAQAKRDHNAAAVITAHHQDDALETVLINLLRGTGWRGLACFSDREDFIRPLINETKAALYEYAVLHRLEWCEDSTNQEDTYLRNRVRHHLVPYMNTRSPGSREKLLFSRTAQLNVRTEIDALLEALVPKDRASLPRAYFAAEDIVAIELLRHFLALSGAPQTVPQTKRALMFARTATNTKLFSLNRQLFLKINRDSLVVVRRES